jgi:predicted nucleic acid-binding Zn ribbon protein
MPVYTYRREDGSTFDIRQSFSDSALTLDPTTGQKVSRVVQNAGVIFKGSGFYVTDSKNKHSASGTESKAKDKDKETASEPASKPAETSTSVSKDAKPAASAAATTSAPTSSSAAD